MAGSVVIAVHGAEAPEGGNYNEIVYQNGKLTVKSKSSAIVIGSLTPLSPQSTTYAVSFETNGGTLISKVNAEKGKTIKEPDAPIRTGFVFKGWFTDKELTTAYDFNAKVTQAFTLYAKWEDEKASQIILTIGQKEVVMFGETITNDVAPEITNNRTMLPIRLIAEALGAKVEWNATERKVTIIRGESKIVVTIGSDKAFDGEKEIILDSPAYIKNNRTYLPVRFVTEALKENVEWDEVNRVVTITKTAK